MNVEIKRKWTAALRSDEYPQGKGSLRTKTGYCCLGVLCDLHRKAHPDEGDWKLLNSRYAYGDPPSNEEFLPWNVRLWAGITDRPNPYVPVPGGGCVTLSELNDDGMPFAEIADLIEAHL